MPFFILVSVLTLGSLENKTQQYRVVVSVSTLRLWSKKSCFSLDIETRENKSQFQDFQLSLADLLDIILYYTIAADTNSYMDVMLYKYPGDDILYKQLVDKKQFYSIQTYTQKSNWTRKFQDESTISLYRRSVSLYHYTGGVSHSALFL